MERYSPKDNVLNKILIIFCILMFFINYLIFSPVEVGASINTDDIHIYEAEDSSFDIPYREYQLKDDDDASDGIAVIPFLSSTETENIFSSSDLSFIANGIYKFYFRARSDTCSPITVGWKSQSVSDSRDHFVLTEDYRWYITQEFEVTDPNTIILWADSNYESVYLDKIMLVRFYDSTGQETTANMGQVTDERIEFRTMGSGDSDEDGLHDLFEVNDNVWWFEAEHHRNPALTIPIIGKEIVGEFYQNDASNSKAIGIRNYPSPLPPSF